MLTFLVIAVIACVWFAAERIALSGRREAARALFAAAAAMAMYAVHARHLEEQKSAASNIAASFVILETRMKAGDITAALEIADRGIRHFSGSGARLDKKTAALWQFATSTNPSMPNQ